MDGWKDSTPKARALRMSYPAFRMRSGGAQREVVGQCRVQGRGQVSVPSQPVPSQAGPCKGTGVFLFSH